MKLFQRAQFNRWTKWFALFPVETESGEVVWLEILERKLVNVKIPNVYPMHYLIYKRP